LSEEEDLLAARRVALEARLRDPASKASRSLPERTPMNALAARAMVVQARLAEAYRRRRGKVQDG
jgi:hypothetical protein